MVYINGDGALHESRPWSLGKITDFFNSVINIIILFFTTLIPGLRSSNPGGVTFRGPGSGSGWGGGGGSGPRGNGGPPRPPKPPPRPRGNFRTFSDTFGAGSTSVPGGCPGGSCGRM